jgi:hypothetical protein
MEDLDHIGKGHQPRSDQDLFTLHALRRAFAIPPLEGLLDAVPHRLGHAELRHEVVRRPPVVLEHGLGVLVAAAEESQPHPRPVEDRLVRRQVPEHEPHTRHCAREVEEADVGLEGQLVAKPLRLLVRVDVAADPSQERRVVHDLAVGLVEAHALGQAQGDKALAQHVLHGLAHPEVGRQRQHRQQLSQSSARRRGGLRHDR